MSATPIYPDYRSSTYVLNKCKTLSKRQLDYWVRKGWVASWAPAPGSGNIRYFHLDEIPVIQYMDILVNQMQFVPDKAAKIAVDASKQEPVILRNQPRIWLDYDGVVIGLPFMRPE